LGRVRFRGPWRTNAIASCPALVQQTADLIAADGTPVKRVEITGARGHLDGVLSLAQVGDVLEAFLDE
jgi:homoserine O-acetyltransferase/O-succinyltransferase